MEKFLSSFSIILEYWYIFAAFLAVITGLYLLERKLKKRKILFSVINLAVNAGLIAVCLILGVGVAPTLLLVLCALIPALFI